MILVISITNSKDCTYEKKVDIKEDGDLTNEISDAYKQHRIKCPETAPFDRYLSVRPE